MDTILSLLKERRLWIAFMPVVVIICNALGVQITEDVLATTGDKVVSAITSLLALWSWCAPKS